MRRIGLAGIGGLALLVALIGVLALDVAWRVWLSRFGFESGADIALLIALELARASVAFGVIGIAATVIARGEPGARAFASALLFLGLVYLKAVQFGAYPGHLQEKLASALLGAGVSSAALAFVFATPIWALPPGIAAFLAYALRYPSRPVADAVRAAHGTGRRGMMRDVTLAGTDVRSYVHRFAAWALDRNWLTSTKLVTGALIATVALMTAPTPVRALVMIVLAMAFGVGLVLLRTSFLASAGRHRRRLSLLAVATGLAVTDLLISSAIGFLPGETIARIALALACLSPVAAVVIMARAVSDGPEHADDRPTVRLTTELPPVPQS